MSPTLTADAHMKPATNPDDRDEWMLRLLDSVERIADGLEGIADAINRGNDRNAQRDSLAARRNS